MIDKFLDHELKSVIQAATTGGFIRLGCDGANTINGLKELLKGSAGGLVTSFFINHLLIKANDENEQRARPNNPRQ